MEVPSNILNEFCLFGIHALEISILSLLPYFLSFPLIVQSTVKMVAINFLSITHEQ